MQSTGGLASGLASGLAFLTEWLSDAENSRLELALPGWVRASGWSRAGLTWSTLAGTPIVWTADVERANSTSTAPAELGEIAKSLIRNSCATVWQMPGTAGRLYARFAPLGQQAGAIWAERSEKEPWTEVDRQYLLHSARLIERSSHLGHALGPVVEPQRLEQRLRDASVIAGRMAHDFDNILTGILGFAELSQPLLPSGSQVARFVGEINSVGSRGIVFTKQLHQLSRSSQYKPQPSSVADVFSKEEARLQKSVPAGVTVTANVPQNLAHVAMDPSPLGTVLGHLLENAIQACAVGDSVSVTARAVDLDSTEMPGFLGQLADGPHIEITVSDTGCGIKPEARARLFAEPFFTTKVRHRGLGLAIVYRILFAHRGGIRIDAAVPPDTGTRVRVVIPLASARPAVAPTAYIPATTTGV